jgi:hypothetical protein
LLLLSSLLLLPLPLLLLLLLSFCLSFRSEAEESAVVLALAVAVAAAVAVACPFVCHPVEDLRLSLLVLAVILSEAKDPETYNPPLPLEPFNQKSQATRHPRNNPGPTSPKKLSTPKPHKTSANPAHSRGIVVTPNQLYLI